MRCAGHRAAACPVAGPHSAHMYRRRGFSLVLGVQGTIPPSAGPPAAPHFSSLRGFWFLPCSKTGNCWAYYDLATALLARKCLHSSPTPGMLPDRPTPTLPDKHISLPDGGNTGALVSAWITAPRAKQAPPPHSTHRERTAAHVHRLARPYSTPTPDYIPSCEVWYHMHYAHASFGHPIMCAGPWSCTSHPREGQVLPQVPAEPL